MSYTPDNYLDIPERELIERIKEKKKELSSSLVILGHNYQRTAIYRLSDFRGDSFGLSKIASEQKDAKYIVFCGVNFMAETAAILCSAEQTVQHPVTDAGCPMADMASIDQVLKVWKELSEVTDISQVIPVTYMNSDANLKAFCGENGGVICTSSNAEAVFDWSFKKGTKILFFPDEHLGRNTAFSKNISLEEQIVWNPKLERGGNSVEQIQSASVILWKGFCHVHQWFTKEHVKNIRQNYPEAKIIIHPESRREVVELCDYAGSTGFIEKFCAQAKPGSITAIGTEINMIQRLAEDYPDKTILPLDRSLCPNMYKISLPSLAYTLDNLGTVNVVKISDAIRDKAGLALKRMLEIGG